MDWYSVKLLYQMKISGKAFRKDRFFRPWKRTFYEESILLVQADSFEAAYKTAEEQAKENCETYRNKYAQTVRVTLYSAVDCFLLADTPKHGTEVYSSIFRQKRAGRNLLKVRYKNSSVEEMHMLRGR